MSAECFCCAIPNTHRKDEKKSISFVWLLQSLWLLDRFFPTLDTNEHRFLVNCHRKARGPRNNRDNTSSDSEHPKLRTYKKHKQTDFSFHQVLLDRGFASLSHAAMAFFAHIAHLKHFDRLMNGGFSQLWRRFCECIRLGGRRRNFENFSCSLLLVICRERESVENPWERQKEREKRGALAITQHKSLNITAQRGRRRKRLSENCIFPHSKLDWRRLFPSSLRSRGANYRPELLRMWVFFSFSTCVCPFNLFIFSFLSRCRFLLHQAPSFPQPIPCLSVAISHPKIKW